MNKKGFTLVEMMIVVIVISGLMFLIVPNVSKSKDSMDTKTCDAYIKLVESQMESYHIDMGTYPVSVTALKDAGYIQSDTCPNGKSLIIVNGEVVIDETTGS